MTQITKKRLNFRPLEVLLDHHIRRPKNVQKRDRSLLRIFKLLCSWMFNHCRKIFVLALRKAFLTLDTFPGIANSVGWLLFCLVYTATGTATIEGLTINAKMHESYRRNGWKEANTVKHPGIWKCALAVIILVCLMSLELLDFPPFWWSVDAHSLWHLGTIPIPLLWYRCVDAYILRNLIYGEVTAWTVGF